MYFEIRTFRLIGDAKQGQTESQIRTFRRTRKAVAKRLRDDILDVHFHSVNEVDFYALYLGSGVPPYGRGIGSYASRMNSIYHRIGVIENPDMADINVGESANFAVAASGTIFSVGSNPYTLYAGRLGIEWFKVDQAAFRGDDVEQVTIGELDNDKVVVVCLHGQGHKISFCEFDDAADTFHETKPHAWSAGAWRWGGWSTYGLPDQVTVLSLAVKAHPPGYSLYAFALDSSGNGQAYEVTFTAGEANARMQAFPDTWFSRSAIFDATNSIAPAPNRQELSPVTISCGMGDTLYVQIGHEMRVRDNGKWYVWPMRQYSGVSDLDIYQARGFEDGTVVLSTNKGLIMRYLDPKSGWKPRDFTDEKIITICFSKGVSRQASTVQELLKVVTEAAEQPV
jgi:hypothetical protein